MIGALGFIWLFPATVFLFAGDYIHSLICGIMAIICFIIKIKESKKKGEEK